MLSSIRERVLSHGGRLVAKADGADVVLEVRSGGMGTDNSETFVGTPRISVPGLMPVELPEIKFWNRTQHLGTAKVGILAYEPKSGMIVPQGGQALARSDDTKWYLLGFGPFQEGSVKHEVSQGAAQPYAMARFTPRTQQPAFLASQPNAEDESVPAGPAAQPAGYYPQASYPPAQYR